MQVTNQWIETRAPFGFENPCDRFFIGSVGTQPVNGLSREGHKPTSTQNANGLGTGGGVSNR